MCAVRLEITKRVHSKLQSEQPWAQRLQFDTELEIVDRQLRIKHNQIQYGPIGQQKLPISDQFVPEMPRKRLDINKCDGVSFFHYHDQVIP
jgi:hypothetical protein